MYNKLDFFNKVYNLVSVMENFYIYVECYNTEELIEHIRFEFPYMYVKSINLGSSEVKFTVRPELVNITDNGIYISRMEGRSKKPWFKLIAKCGEALKEYKKKYSETILSFLENKLVLVSEDGSAPCTSSSVVKDGEVIYKGHDGEDKVFNFLRDGS